MQHPSNSSVVESKPDNPADDLRLSQPWPELEQYALSLDFSKMDSTEHSHTPYVVILLQHAAKWRKEVTFLMLKIDLQARWKAP